ncbi:Methyl-CpG binding protein [Operophtera brumata]|uniref:Methyl-CpG binding protein n=1 Tax=Operophtera brumata TaxID=104452 RepID=A0A0L7KSR1_OPEBR|nr:Methyl-CpG binding protein [Operophtera brumata]
MRNFLETADDSIKAYEPCLMDFGVHLKLARKLGWIVSTPDGVTEAPETILPANSTSCLSPLVKRKSLSLKRRAVGLKLKDKMWVGSLKVQVIDNLLRCPADGCFKNFRNNTLLQMHIKHYHRELRKMMGATPKVLDLAAARTKPTRAERARTDPKVIKVKINRPPKRDEPKYEHKHEQDIDVDIMRTPTKDDTAHKIPRSQDSPKLRNALVNKPVKRPRVLLPVRRSEPEQSLPDSLPDDDLDSLDASVDVPTSDVLDFETAISTHTVTKPLEKKKKKGDKKQKSFASFAKNISEDEEWFAMNSDEVDTRFSFPRSATPDDSKMIDPKSGLLMSSDLMDDPMDPSLYTFTESGERIKIVHMRREEIINCHCGFREEDGLMVPEKYTCSICLNPRRGRRSKRFVHDQDRLYEGLLPGAKADESVRRSHELAGNLLRIEDALHALRVKYYVAT